MPIIDLSDPIQYFDEIKTTEASSILLKLEGGEMNYMKLIKLLYIIDKKSLKEKERPITFDLYFSMKDGQVLSTVLDLVKGVYHGVYWHSHIAKNSTYTVKLLDSDLIINKLSKSDVRIIEDVYSGYGKYDQFSLGKLTKKGTEYKSTTSSIRTSLDAVLADLQFSNTDIEQIKNNLKEKVLINSQFRV